MKKAMAVVLLMACGAVYAACPFGTKYQCFPTPSGKMACGCF